MITTNRIGLGEFKVFWNGRPTQWHIWNGSNGVSGRGRNVYGIYHVNGTIKWIGSLAACKKFLAQRFTKTIGPSQGETIEAYGADGKLRTVTQLRPDFKHE